MAHLLSTKGASPVSVLALQLTLRERLICSVGEPFAGLRPDFLLGPAADGQADMAAAFEQNAFCDPSSPPGRVNGVPWEQGTRSSLPAMMFSTGQVMFLRLTMCLPTGIRFWVRRFFW